MLARHHGLELLDLVGVFGHDVVLLGGVVVDVVELIVVGGRADAQPDELPGPDAGRLAVALGELEVDVPG